MSISSNINEVIRAISSILIFFYEEILHAQKSTKKDKKHKTQTSDLYSDDFYAHKKHKKHKKRLSLRCFLRV